MREVGWGRLLTIDNAYTKTSVYITSTDFKKIKKMVSKIVSWFLTWYELACRMSGKLVHWLSVSKMTGFQTWSIEIAIFFRKRKRKGTKSIFIVDRKKRNNRRSIVSNSVCHLIMNWLSNFCKLKIRNVAEKSLKC